ncbi:hypothetical protein Xph01_06580 [Micromonospora phaseoli]|nr:hypothetical protein Xph01_06580 [Micromonospora phaseoli]
MWRFRLCLTFGSVSHSELWKTAEFSNIYLEIDRRSAAGEVGGRQDFHYSKLPPSQSLEAILLRDGPKLTSGLKQQNPRTPFGRPIMSFTGSFDVEWNVVGYQNNNPVVEYHVTNATTIASGTRVPGVTPHAGMVSPAAEWMPTHLSTTRSKATGSASPPV